MSCVVSEISMNGLHKDLEKNNYHFQKLNYNSLAMDANDINYLKINFTSPISCNFLLTLSMSNIKMLWIKLDKAFIRPGVVANENFLELAEEEKEAQLDSLIILIPSKC